MLEATITVHELLHYLEAFGLGLGIVGFFFLYIRLGDLRRK
jgi:hypothetical protein